MLTYVLFVIGFIFLIKGAAFLVDGASALARKVGVSDLVIGLTIVAFGTSAPELLVNTYASFQGASEIAIGNILGSNIANTFLILGVSAIIYNLMVTRETVWKQIPLGLFAACVLGILANDILIAGSEHSQLSRIDGLILLSFFLVFIYYVFGLVKDQRDEAMDMVIKYISPTKIFLLITVGLVGLSLGAYWIVNGAINIAEALGTSQTMIGLTVVALGTSLPELATSAMAAYRKNADLAVGNIVGSNIFNILFILGLSATIRPLPFDTILNVDIGVVIFSSLLLFIAMFTGRGKNLLDRREGSVFIILYAAYVTYVVLRG